MAQFYTDFRNETVGASPSGLSLQFGDVTFQVQSGNTLASSDRSVIIQPGAGTYERSAISVDNFATSGETTVRILANFKSHSAATNGAIVGAFLSGTGDDASRTGYFQYHRRENYQLTIYDSGAETPIGAFSNSAVTSVIETWYLEIYRSGSLIELRSWKPANSRPATPTLSYTDPSALSLAGNVGISALLSSLASNPDMVVYEVVAASDGDALPTGPVSNLPAIRKGSQFTVETALAGTVTSATLNGNAITVDSHVGTTVTLTDSDASITTSGAYDLVLTDDAAATETIVMQVNVVGVAPSNNPVEKDGAAQASLTGVQVRVTGGANLNGAELYYTGTATTDASGNLASIDLSSTAAVETDPVLLHIRTAAGDSIIASETVGLI